MSIAMWFAFLLRTDVRAGEAPADPKAQRNFVVWWMLWGQLEYPAVWHWDTDQADVAMELVSIGPDLRCPLLLHRLHASRPDLQRAFPLENAEDLFEFFCWYRIYGGSEIGAAPQLPPDCLAATEAPSRRPRWRYGGVEVPRIAVVLAQRIPNLISDDSSKGRNRAARNVRDWYNEHGWRLIPAAARPQAATVPPGATEPPRKGGVNLVGFVRGEFGLGEDVRMAATAFEAAGIPFALINVTAGAAVSQQDQSMTNRIVDRLQYDTTLYCMSAFDTAALYLARGPAFFSDQYRIGYWPWEFQRFPAIWNDVDALVHEIWTGSVFTAEAYRTSSSRPVFQLPCPVVLPKIAVTPRSGLGLPEKDTFVFVYAFDINSGLARKNPHALVRAFRRAFLPQDRGVALLLRINGRPETDPGWIDVATEITGDDRILTLTGTLDRRSALGIVAACDCFVSPHRAEGFGRNIAEAILLGIPVLATAYSGCADFLAGDEGIPFEPVAVREAEYPFADGLWWAEPSIDDMARRMQEIRHARDTDRIGSDRRLASRSAEIAAAYGARAVGEAFAARLRASGRLPSQGGLESRRQVDAFGTFRPG